MQTDDRTQSRAIPTLSHNSPEFGAMAFAEPIEPHNEDPDSPLLGAEPVEPHKEDSDSPLLEVKRFEPISSSSELPTLDDADVHDITLIDGEPVVSTYEEEPDTAWLRAAATIDIPQPDDSTMVDRRNDADGPSDALTPAFDLPDTQDNAEVGAQGLGTTADEPDVTGFVMAAPPDRIVMPGLPTDDVSSTAARLGRMTEPIVNANLGNASKPLGPTQAIQTAQSTASNPIGEPLVVDKPHTPRSSSGTADPERRDKPQAIKKPRTFTLPSDARPTGPNHADMISIAENVKTTMFDTKIHEYMSYSRRLPKPNEQFVGSPRGTDDDRRIVMYSPEKDGVDRYVHLSKNMTQQLRQKFADIVDKAFENPKSRLGVGVGFSGDVTAQYVPPGPDRKVELLRKLRRLPPVESADSTKSFSTLTLQKRPMHTYRTPTGKTTPTVETTPTIETAPPDATASKVETAPNNATTSNVATTPNNATPPTIETTPTFATTSNVDNTPSTAPASPNNAELVTLASNVASVERADKRGSLVPQQSIPPHATSVKAAVKPGPFSRLKKKIESALGSKL